MKEKISQLLIKNQIDFKNGFGGFCDFIFKYLQNKFIINCKTYFDNDLMPYYSIEIKVVFKDDKCEYSCFSYDFDKCLNYFDDIMKFTGVFPKND